MQFRLFSPALLCLLLHGVHHSNAKSSADIPKGSSKVPGDSDQCGLPELKLTLTECTDPLAEGVPDHRGNWTNPATGEWHVIEQCGERYVVAGIVPPAFNNGTYYYVHDFLKVDGSPEGGLLDYSMYDFPKCVGGADSVEGAVGMGATFDGTCMNVGREGMVVVSRCLGDDGKLTKTSMGSEPEVFELVATDKPHDSEGDGGDDSAGPALKATAATWVAAALLVLAPLL